MRALSIAAVLSLMLAGCASNGPDTSTWTYAEVVAYREAREAREAQGRANMAAVAEALQSSAQRAQQFNSQMQSVAQSTAPQTYEVGPYGQPNNTAVVYCNDVSASVTTCRQVR